MNLQLSFYSTYLTYFYRTLSFEPFFLRVFSIHPQISVILWVVLYKMFSKNNSNSDKA